MNLSRLSIKYHLFIIVFIIAFPAICIIINSGIKQRKDAVHNAQIETQKLAETIVNEQKNLIASIRQLFIVLSQLPDVKSHNRIKTQAILTEIFKQSPQYTIIFIADTSGMVWASSVPLKEIYSVSDRRYFKNALASGKLSSGEYHIGRLSNKATFSLGYPLKDDYGKITGIICVGLSLDYYHHIIESYKLPQGASFSLIDHKGIILTRAVEPEKYIGKQSNPEIFKKMQEGPEEETSAGTSNAAGDYRIRTYRKLSLEGESTPYMYIRAGIPLETVMSSANAALINNLSIYAIFLSAAFLLSWLISKKYIIDRVLVLEQSSKRLADGDLNIRIADKVTGGELGNLGKSLDVMARKLMLREEALANSKRFLKAIINTEPECVMLIDAESRLRMMNRAGLEMIQADSFEQVEGHSYCSIVTSVYRDAFMKLTSEALHGGSGRLEFEIEGIKGLHLWMETHIVPFCDERGDAVSALCIARDITEQKKAEHYNIILKKHLAQSQKYESIGRLAGGIAHDFNNLLTPIIGYAGLLEKEFTKDSIGAQRLHNIMLASDKAKNLVQQLLIFSRKQVLDRSILDINPLILSFHDILQRTIRENIEIRLCLTPDIISISADRNQLEQIIMNLVVNAQDAISDNGLITIETAPAILDEEFCRMHIGAKPGRYLMLSVSDNGSGMDKEIQQQLFEPFFTTKGVGHGTGLGLSTVYGIVKQHGGILGVNSEVGIGSSFKLYFPVVDESPAKELIAEVVKPKKQTKCNILLVEDNEMVRDMTYELLKETGFNVFAAEGPIQAIQKCDESIFDLLVSDVIMPDMAGPELYAHLIQLNPGLKVLYMSGYSENLILHHGVLNNGVCYIQKPFTHDKLLNKIEEVLTA